MADPLTKFQRDQRMLRIAQLFAIDPREAALRKAICAEFNIGWRQANRWIAKARAELAKMVDVPLEQAKTEAINFYRSVISSPLEPTKNKLLASAQLDKIYGCLAPVKQTLTNLEGTGPYVPLTDEAIRARLVEELTKLDYAARQEILAQVEGPPVLTLEARPTDSK